MPLTPTKQPTPCQSPQEARQGHNSSEGTIAPTPSYPQVIHNGSRHGLTSVDRALSPVPTVTYDSVDPMIAWSYDRIINGSVEWQTVEGGVPEDSLLLNDSISPLQNSHDFLYPSTVPGYPQIPYYMQNSPLPSEVQVIC